jgi:HipA-like protein
MRTCQIFRREAAAGTLVEDDAGHFTFIYEPSYLANDGLPPVSLTMPKRAEPYRSTHLFPCFVALLAEGALATEQCRRLRLDERDLFGRLMATCRGDCIGSLRIEPVGEMRQ